MQIDGFWVLRLAEATNEQGPAFFQACTEWCGHAHSVLNHQTASNKQCHCVLVCDDVHNMVRKTDMNQKDSSFQSLSEAASECQNIQALSEDWHSGPQSISSRMTFWNDCDRGKQIPYFWCYWWGWCKNNVHSAWAHRTPQGSRTLVLTDGPVGHLFCEVA